MSTPDPAPSQARSEPEAEPPSWLDRLDRNLLSLLVIGGGLLVLAFVPQVSNLLRIEIFEFSDAPLTRLLAYGLLLILVVVFSLVAFAIVPWQPLEESTWRMRLQGRFARIRAQMRDWHQRLGSYGRYGLWPALMAGGLAVAMPLLPHRVVPTLAQWEPVVMLTLLCLAWFFVPSDPPWAFVRERPRLRQFYRRCWDVATLALPVLMLSFLLGELLWLLAIWSPFTASAHLYTVWALLHLLLLAILLARTLDYVFERALPRVAVMIVALVVLVAPSGLVVLQPLPLDETAVSWIQHVEQRINEIPEGGPVIAIAASGGGSRAALYTMMTLRALRHLDLEGNVIPCDDRTTKSLYDHVLLISSVSGGSLAVAHDHFGIDERCPSGSPHNTLLADLDRPLIAELSRRAGLWQAPDYDPAKGSAAPCRPFLTELKAGSSQSVGLREQLSCLALTRIFGADDEQEPWPFSSTAVDDVATDFMAPLLRGILTPGLERGRATSQFWQRRLGWPELANSSKADRREGDGPVLFFNATDADTGQRFVLGYPPLPAGILDPDSAQSLADRCRGRSLDLHQMVRASANFPFGFSLPRLGSCADRDSGPTTVRLIDGGVVDNTGIDTLAFVLDGLLRLSRDPLTTDELPGRILWQLRQKQLVVLEIDSGAKVGAPSAMLRALPALMPLHSLKRAAQERAEQNRAGHLSTIAQAVGDTGFIEIYESSEDAPVEPPRMHLRTAFKNDTQGVMTAWALGSTDKGRVIGSFLFQLMTEPIELASLAPAAEASEALLDVVSSERAASGDRVGPELALASNLLSSSQRLEGVNRLGQLSRGRGKPDPSALLEDRQVRQISADFEPSPIAYAADDSAPDLIAPPSADPGESPASDTPSTERRGWLFVGTHDGTGWTSRALAVDPESSPSQLAGGRFETLIGSYVRNGLPGPQGKLPESFAVLPVGTEVEIERCHRWPSGDCADPAATGIGFVFAQVSLPAEQSQ